MCSHILDQTGRIHMLEDAIEFSVVARAFGDSRHDIFVPGERSAIARIELLKHDKHGHKIETKVYGISEGPEFQHTVGYLRSGEALDSTQQNIGLVAIPDRNGRGSTPGEFQQFQLGTLIRTEEKRGRLVHYSSPTSAGFTIAKPRSSTRCKFTIHDKRVNRILALAAYMHEKRLPLLYQIFGYLFAGILNFIELIFRILENR